MADGAATPAIALWRGRLRRRGIVRALASPAGLIGIAVLAGLGFVALFADVLAPADPFARVGPALQAPSQAHPMGTDQFGRDVLSGVMHGARTSVLVAGVTGAAVLVLGLVVGVTSGYRGGWIDDVLMRVTEAFQTLPRFFLAIVVIALFGSGLDRLVLVLGFTSWALLARVVRSEVLSLREREFVEAAVASGASHLRICVRELLPNVLPSAVVVVAVLLAQVMLIEASLSFLGLGDPNAMSWGYLAGEAQRFLRVAWWLSFFPGMALVVAVVGLNLLSDAVNDVTGGRR